jgi:hypothetical protein
MPYIGNDIQYGELNSQTFTGDGSTTAFTLTYTVSNVNSLLVTVADVIQEPTTAYTVSGTTLTFTSAPANLDTIHVRYLGRTLDVGTTAIVQDSDQDTLIQVEESADEDTIRFDTGGTERVTINSTSVTSTIPLYIPDGSALTPSITNTGDTNTGIFFPAADTVGVAVGGTEVWRYGSNPTTAKNLIINGAISVAQRGTSFTSYGATNNAYSLDQYKIPVAGSASARWTVTQESSGGVSGNAKWLKALVTTADTPGAAEGQAIIQRPEGQSIQALRRDGGGTKAATYSFDVIVHADGGSGLSFPVSLPVVFIIHDNVTDREIVSDVSVAAADTWERVTVSFPEDTSGGGPVNTSSAGSSVGITLAAGSNYVITADTWQNNTNVTLKTSSSDNFADATNNYVGFTEVQLEVGSVATDFEHEDYGTTLAKCLRYFERIQPTVADARFPGGALTSAANAGQHVLPFLVQKRAVPTVTGTAAATFGWVEGDATEQAVTGISYVVTDLTCTTVVCVLSSAATGGGHLKRDGSDTTHIDASAEL